MCGSHISLTRLGNLIGNITMDFLNDKDNKKELSDENLWAYLERMMNREGHDNDIAHDLIIEDDELDIDYDFDDTPELLLEFPMCPNKLIEVMRSLFFRNYTEYLSMVTLLRTQTLPAKTEKKIQEDVEILRETLEEIYDELSLLSAYKLNCDDCEDTDDCI